MLNAGPNQTLYTALTPNDWLNYTMASASVTINVTKATPVISCSNPADIVYGTALSDTQLSRQANVAGTFSYGSLAGTVLSAGSGQPLTVTFTPFDTQDLRYGHNHGDDKRHASHAPKLRGLILPTLPTGRRWTIRS